MNVIKLKYYDRTRDQKGLFFRVKKNRVIYRFPANLRDNKDFIQKLVNKIEKYENETSSENKQSGTHYALLNRDGNVVLVDKGTFLENKRYS